MSNTPIAASSRLAAVQYEIRGALDRRAGELEAGGTPVLKLNIGNPALFGLRVPATVETAVRTHLDASAAYCQQQGLPQAREAIASRYRNAGANVEARRVFIGNGVSELIDMTLRALLEPGDEVLVPAPDYPLWSAATRLNGGVPVHYPCPAGRDHLPDAGEIEARITPRTRALVVINPNNPTGAVYPRALLRELVATAARHDLLLLGDEIYDSVRYDAAPFVPIASLSGDAPCISYGGLSKTHFACGYRVGWLAMGGEESRIAPLLAALDKLAALRLCSNVTAQWAIEPALASRDEISRLTAPGGRLFAARACVVDAVARSAFLTLVAPRGALYAFPAVRDDALPGFDDMDFAQGLLEAEHILLVPGRNFNIAARNHFRVTLLPEPAVLADAFERIERHLERLASAGHRRVA
ncbi:MAG: aminotransferase class I/II-fold pyridoxal phosphate-dependent enzyme [Lysobacterales bacterium]